MNPQIEVVPAKLLLGVRWTMSLTSNHTAELWRILMPKRTQIEQRASNDLISLTIYPLDYFKAFSPTTEFEKWAAVEVSAVTDVPLGFQLLSVPEGLYAAFNYKGSSADTSIFERIFNHWLPTSDFALDDRPHVEVLGAEYRNNDPSSEEKIYVPVRFKHTSLNH